MEEPIKILVIDDDKLVLRTMKNTLEDENYTVETASTGEEGISRAGKELYDIIFLDLNIPDKQGIEIMRIIRSFDTQVAIVIMTGYGTVDSSITAMKLNAADYILKPVDPDQVQQLVKDLMLRKKLEKEIMGRSPKPKVLLVKGKDATIDLIGEKLNQEKIRNLVVHSPKEAVSWLKEDMAINTVIADLGKKEVNGIELLRTLKEISPDILFIPVVSIPDMKESVDLFKEGARDYLVKPVQPDELVTSLRQAWLAQSQGLLNRQLLLHFQKNQKDMQQAYEHYKKIMADTE